MLILFVRNGNAFLPEINAYVKFFSGIGIACEVVYSKALARVECDVEWHLMGLDREDYRRGICKIHDYASASIPPYRKGKDLLKKWLNAKPDYRLYLNEYVMQQMDFKDGVPFGFRDMGISLESKSLPVDDDYDFICVGEGHGFKRWISAFTDGALKNRSLLILSKSYERIAGELKKYRNIRFIGPVAHHEVGGYISRARFGLNFIPDTEPFNHQTSTKFLEYASARVPIVTTDYRWVRDFQKQYGGNYFYVKPDFSNLCWESIRSFNYEFPDMKDFEWNRQIRNSGVLKFLQSRFPDAISLCDSK